MSTLGEAPPATAKERPVTRLGGGRPRRVLVVAAALFVAAAGFGLAIAAFHGTSEPPLAGPIANGAIAFAMLSDSGWQIFTINPDGTGLTRLTDLPTSQFHPAWSPDGTRIAFDAQSAGGRSFHIYEMNADGSGLQRLTNGPSWNYLPAWSPDGTRIAFVSNRDGNDEIYVMNADGSGQTRLTDDPDEDLSPAWSPDGTRIAFQTNRDSNNEIYVMAPDGTNQMMLTDSKASFDGDPAWSPDGSRIAFVSDRDGQASLYVMNADGTGVTLLAHSTGYGDRSWSPDGGRIAFNQGGSPGDIGGIYVVDVETRSVTKLFEGPVGELCCPAWQPVPTGPVSPATSEAATPIPTPTPVKPRTPFAQNGLIAFGCGYHVCTVTPDGSAFTDLIEPYDRDLVLAAYSPVFSPDGSKIAFRGYPKGAVSGGANYDLYLMNADGTGVTNVTTSPDDVQSGFSQYYAQWSPDGSRIAYDSDDGFHVMNADGSDSRKIVDGGSPTWSPDGSWIAFVMGRDHGADLWKIHPDGTGLTQLTQSTDWDELPVWSPDGSRIAFLRHGGLYLVNADGTGLTVLADIKGAFPFQPQWSPDGARLIFEVEMPSEAPSDQAGRNYDIFAVNADGSGLIDLTPTADVTENYPIWSPDGSKIAFGASDVLTGDNTGTYDLYTMNPDGTGVDRLTTDAGPGVEFDISWQRALG